MRDSNSAVAANSFSFLTTAALKSPFCWRATTRLAANSKLIFSRAAET